MGYLPGKSSSVSCVRYGDRQFPANRHHLEETFAGENGIRNWNTNTRSTSLDDQDTVRTWEREQQEHLAADDLTEDLLRPKPVSEAPKRRLL
jgi:hypothetical protein